jgi:DNA-binding transcriptional LysR family regulator
VLTYVKDILATNEMLELRVSQLRGATAGAVRLGVIESIAVNWLPSILSAYRAQHPDVKVTVQQSGYREMINGVQSQKLDLAVVSHTAARGAEAPLQFIPLVQDRIVCVSREPLPGATERFVPVEALRGQKVVLLYGGDEMDVEAYLRQQDVSVEVTASAHANTALTSLVECGLGCGITTELALSGADRAGLTVLPLVPLCFRDLGIITRDPKFLSEAAKQMLQAFTDYVQ